MDPQPAPTAVTNRPPFLPRWLDPAEPGCLRRLRRAAVGCALLTLALGIVAAGLALSSTTGRYVMARLALRSGAEAWAAHLAAGLIDDNPHEWEFYRIRGYALRRTDAFEEALGVYEEAAARLPEAWWPRSHRCFYGALFGDPQAALPWCDEALALAPERSALAYERRAVARALAGDLVAAADDLRAMQRIADADAPRGDPRIRDGAPLAAWIAALEEGRNPIEGDALSALRDRYD